jgi:tetratricopeptide (TPR) repeat protein
MGDRNAELARRNFQEAMDIDPQCAAAWCGLAELAEGEGRLREALQIYLRAMRAEQFLARAWLGGARVLRGLGFDDNAMSWTQRVATLQPEHPVFTEGLGSTGSRSQEEAAEV